MSLFPDPSERLAHASSWEWWLGNGLGGWASGSASGALTRKYHGLLAVAHPSASQRHLLLGKIEETALAGSRSIPLSTNHYPGVVHPDGYLLIERFMFDGAAARWTFRVAGRRLAKEVWCDRARPATYVRYTLLEGDPLGLELVPFVSGRSAHGLGLPDFMRENAGGQVRPDGVQWSEPFPWGLQVRGGLLRPHADFYYNVCYPREEERQEADREDWAVPGRFECMLREGHHALVCAWASPPQKEETKSKEFAPAASGPRPAGSASASGTPHPSSAPQLDSLADPEEASRRLSRVVDEFRAYNHWGEIPWLENLVRASDAFIVRQGPHYNVLAGYPYFGIWARDALISVPGLCLYTGRHALARDILEGWMAALQGGLLPNRYDERGRPAFESADGTLWLFWALGHLDSEGGMSESFLSRHWPVLRDTLSAWLGGTSLTCLDSDGLISLQGDRLTWMDAARDGKALTPRPGKRIEINALWLNALSLGSQWALRAGERAMAERLREAHASAAPAMDRFYNEDSHYFHDGIDPPDASLRPNQLWALALPRAGASPVQARRALGALVHTLWLEGAGPRTLAPTDEHYHPVFNGDARWRDEAYHQGAIWPWLAGAWTEAWLRHYPKRAEELNRQLAALAGPRLPGALLGVPEVRDPSSGASGGCPTQAWSVAEVLRAAVIVERARRWHGASAILSPDLSEITAALRKG